MEKMIFTFLFILPLFIVYPKNQGQYEANNTHTMQCLINDDIVNSIQKNGGIQGVWSGKIGDTYKIVMCLVRDDDKLRGNYFYETVGADMLLNGTFSGSPIVLKEYNEKRKHTGTFEGIIKNGAYQGFWYNADRSKQMKFTLNKLDYSNGCHSVTVSETNADIPGYPEEIYPYPAFNCSDKKLEKRLSNLFSFASLTGYSVEDIQEQIQLSEEYNDIMLRVFSELAYEVMYNKNCILSVTTTTVTVGAHLNYSSKNFNVSLIKGTHITINDLVKPDKIKALATYCNTQLQKIIQKDIEENDYSNAPEIIGMLEDHEFDERNLHYFHFTDDGIVFEYGFDFPHVYKAAEPSGNILVVFDQLKPFAKPKGPLQFLF